MSFEEEKANQNEGVRGLLNEDHKAELGEILAFGEKYKKEGEEMRKAFWRKGYRGQFDNLIMQYEDSKDRFMKGLPEGKGMLDGLNDIAKEKFYEKYLFDRIVYSGDPEYKKEGESIQYHGEMGDIKGLKGWVVENKNNLKPGMKIDLSDNDISKDGIRILAETWKDSLQLGMCIDLKNNNIGDEGVKILVKEWRGKLKPGMKINFGRNGISDRGAKILAEEWKDSLQPGMHIDLSNNEIRDEGVIELVENWKDSLKQRMVIDLEHNGIGDQGAHAIAEQWKDSLQPGMVVNLKKNEISDNKIMELDKLEESKAKAGSFWIRTGF